MPVDVQQRFARHQSMHVYSADVRVASIARVLPPAFACPCLVEVRWIEQSRLGVSGYPLCYRFKQVLAPTIPVLSQGILTGVPSTIKC